ncbi:MAG: TIGR00341 family protein [Bacteroidetes bacterium]|nr:TIGR00341 family protein [Bacteroidota bacterium]
MDSNFLHWLRGLFNLETYKSREDEVVDSIRANVEFRGSNLWVLIFAIFIASIGLNVNSAAVIIGAMLISPLMGPIIGMGLGVGIYDFALIKKSAINLGVAAIISIATAALYFLLTPLKFAHSELLARTTPTTWDVLIAFFGGLAGIIATSTKEKGNVIPGVAIATALMPPLCTAGYGLATGQLPFFFGAAYLFLINSVFICYATVLIVRYLKFRKYSFVDEQVEKRMKRLVSIIIFITIVPSIYIAYNLVLKSIFENRVESFIDQEMLFESTAVAQKKISYENQKVELLLIGAEIDSSELMHIQRRLPYYDLGKVNLIIKQGRTKIENKSPELDLNLVQNILGDKEKQLQQKDSLIRKLNERIKQSEKEAYPTKAILKEIQAQGYPASFVGIGQLEDEDESGSNQEKICVAIIRLKKSIRNSDKERLESWLKVRTQSREIRVYYEIK